jgi:phospholipid/cholesterol/gamma-HCH transport system ATP-binding protein
MSSRPFIEVRDLVIRNQRGLLLDRLSFEVKHGEVVVILGSSGCGKSTLLKHLIGLHVPTSGDILIDGQSIIHADQQTRRDLMRGFGVLYQSSALFGSMTLLGNVALPLEEHTRLPQSLIETLAQQRLAAVGLAGFETYLPAKISGGMKKRAGLARALALDPKLLFLDEPSAGLDPIASAELDQLIIDLRDTFGATMVVVTHELDSIFAIANRALVLRNGTIAAYDAVDVIARQHEDPWIQAFFSRGGTKDYERAGA